MIDAWFPRSIDRGYGGFLCDFDRSWKPNGRQNKLLEFQARQTWIAAELARHYPNETRLRDAAAHGFRFLREVMWDHGPGGWFHRVNRDGRPLEAHTKHVHGIAYAISACAAVHAAGIDAAALSLAKVAFDWLEDHALDREHGGYFGFLTRDGRVIRDSADSPLPGPTDTISTAFGFKDANVHADLLEAFTFLYAAWPDERVATRLRELVDVFGRRMLLASGALWFYCRPDWSPVPHIVNYGYSFHVGNRLLGAARVLGDEEVIIGVAGRIVDFGLRRGWDAAVGGGFFYAGPAEPPMRIQGVDLVVRAKAWWIQLEALDALLALATVGDGGQPYLRYHAAVWDYIQRHLIDHRQAGLFAFGLDKVPRWRRAWGDALAPAHLTYKGDAWKDASHEGRAFLSCLRTLGALPATPSR